MSRQTVISAALPKMRKFITLSANMEHSRLEYILDDRMKTFDGKELDHSSKFCLIYL